MKVIKLLSLSLLMSCAGNSPVKIDPLDAKQDEYRQCYLESNSYGGKNAATTGKVDVSFIIKKDGSVDDEKITETTFKDANFHACLLSYVRELKFGPQEVERRVTRSINFYEKEE